MQCCFQTRVGEMKCEDLKTIHIDSEESALNEGRCKVRTAMLPNEDNL